MAHKEITRRKEHSMSKSKRLSVSKAKLAETGEVLEIAGTMAEIEGVDLVATGHRPRTNSCPPPMSNTVTTF